jgi:hypothetical protein
MFVSEAEEVRHLRDENSRLKKLVAELTRDRRKRRSTEPLNIAYSDSDQSLNGTNPSALRQISALSLQSILTQCGGWILMASATSRERCRTCAECPMLTG